MTRPADPRTLLKRYGLHPRHSLGQNFLVDPGAPARIATGADLRPEDTVLEIGAGLGTLTVELATRAGHVVAVETDPELVAVLEDLLADEEGVEIVQGDILELQPADLVNHAPEGRQPLWGELLEDYVVVGNLPYYITAPVLRHILEAEIRPARMVITVQLEVARRMVAFDDKMSVLAVALHFYGRPRILFRLKRGAFYPVPKVESAVVRLDLYKTPPVEVTDVERFFRVVRAGFAQRRKQLHNTLAASLHLDKHRVSESLEGGGIAPTRRAETLSVAEWAQVLHALDPLLDSM